METDEMNEVDKGDPALIRLMAERHQSHSTRKDLFKKLEDELGRPVVTYFTSFAHPGPGMVDEDVDMLTGLLQMMDLSDGLALMISSPGGDGVSAERLINSCRNYSSTGKYWAIVPGKAKSAATMVCFGASKLLMGPTSELGPVDPQVAVKIGDGDYKLIAAHHVVSSYRQLFEDAEKSKGNLEPYVQQLQHYDARIVAEYESLIDLSKDMSVKALKTGMMADLDEDEIEERIKMFLTPTRTRTHARPIYREEADRCGLVTEALDPAGRLWALIYELYIRTNNYVSQQVVKCIESKEDSFVVG